MKEHDHQFGCGCDCGCDRRSFLAAMGTAMGGLTFTALAGGAEEDAAPSARKEGATVRVVFLYPPTKRYTDDPNAWWSWPGNDFDAEGRQKQYTAALREIEKKLGMQLAMDDGSAFSNQDVESLAKEIETNPPDGLLLIVFANHSRAQGDLLLKAAEKLEIPVVYFIALGVTHGSIRQYRRAGVYFIQSLDNLEAIEYGLRMINAKKLMSQSRLLSITEANEPAEAAEGFFGTKIRLIPFAHYAEEFAKVALDDEAQAWMDGVTRGATEIRVLGQEALANAARAHFALVKLLADEHADGVAMHCLPRGMLKPCISFSVLNGELTPAACQNDFNSALIMLLGKYLIGRPGFVHNLCYETEHNTYYASHCTCPTKVYGPDGAELPYLLRRFAHSNEGSCAIQVFWKEGDPVTVAEYYADQASQLGSRPGVGAMWRTDAAGNVPTLDVYAGKVAGSHPNPPAAGCTTNVELEITDRADACRVFGGHAHNVLFCGDFARHFRLFTLLYKMKLADTGFTGVWPL